MSSRTHTYTHALSNITVQLLIREFSLSGPLDYKYHPLLLLDPRRSLSNSFPNNSSSVSGPKLSSNGFHSAMSAETALVMPGDLI